MFVCDTWFTLFKAFPSFLGLLIWFSFVDILQLGVYMIHFQMHCYALVIQLETRRNLDLHTCFQMEGQKEQGEQKGFHLPC